MKKVWFVTGASKGLGLSLIKRLLKEGHKVAATSRDVSALISKVGSKSEDFLPLSMDLSSESSVAEAVSQTVEHLGTIDVLVNNAGYGQGGAVEEVSNDLARKNFEVNVFGLLNVTRGILPVMRKQKSGHIFNIASIGGFTGAFSGFGIYCGTKFAVAGITEGLHADLTPLGIKVTLIYPGYFRTDFLASDSFSNPDKKIENYEGAHQLLARHENEIGGNQPGDPEKAAEAFLEVASHSNPPLHLFLGSDSYGMAQQKIQLLIEELERNKLLSYSTNF